MNDVVLGDGFRLRRADIDDVDFLAELAGHDDVEPFLSVRRARDPDGVREEIQRSLAEPQETGRFVIEVEENGAWRRAGYSVLKPSQWPELMSRLNVLPNPKVSAAPSWR